MVFVQESTKRSSCFRDQSLQPLGYISKAQRQLYHIGDENANSFNGRLFPSRLSQLLEDFESFLHGIFHEVCFFLILFTVKFYIFPGRFKYIFQVNIS